MVYVTRNEPILFYFQMVGQLFQHFFLNNPFLSINLKHQLYDILVSLIGLIATFLCYSIDLSILLLKKIVNIFPEAYFFYSLIFTHSTFNMSCFPFLNTKCAFPTTFKPCLHHLRGNFSFSFFLHKVDLVSVFALKENV